MVLHRRCPAAVATSTKYLPHFETVLHETLDGIAQHSATAEFIASPPSFNHMRSNVIPRISQTMSNTPKARRLAAN